MPGHSDSDREQRQQVRARGLHKGPKAYQKRLCCSRSSRLAPPWAGKVKLSEERELSSPGRPQYTKDRCSAQVPEQLTAWQFPPSPRRHWAWPRDALVIPAVRAPTASSLPSRQSPWCMLCTAKSRPRELAARAWTSFAVRVTNVLPNRTCIVEKMADKELTNVGLSARKPPGVLRIRFLGSRSLLTATSGTGPPSGRNLGRVGAACPHQAPFQGEL